MSDKSHFLEEIEPTALFDLIIQHSDDAIISKTLDGKVVSWNPGAERLFGFTASEMIGESILKTYPRDRIKEEKDILAKIALGQMVQHFETVRINKAGNLIPVSVTASPILNSKGQVLGASSIARDITSRVIADRISNQFKAIIDCSDDAIVGKTLSGEITSWNRGAEKVFGYSADEIIGQSIIKLFPSERVNEERDIISRISSGERVEHFETIRLRKDGTAIHVSVSVSPIYVDGVIVGASKIARDITSRVEAEKINNQFRAIVDYSQDAIISKDIDGSITSWNRGAEDIFGFTQNEMLGQPISRLIPPDKQEEEAIIMSRILDGERVHHFESVRLTKNGDMIDVSITISPIMVGNKVVGASKVARNITSEVRARRQVWYKANYDSLTHLPNRDRFITVLNKELKKANFNKMRFAVMFIDLDNFKLVNDNFGHFIGDKVIQMAAEAINAATDNADFVARLGGDEFVVISHTYLHENEINELSKRILNNLNSQTTIQDHLISTSASIGIANYPEHGEVAEELIQKADYAMYISKSMGRNQSHFFHQANHDQGIADSYELLCDLRAADLSQEIEVYFQPIQHARTGEINKAEVLARWHHPKKGVIGPDVFIPLAEKYGLILALGDVVTQKALKCLYEFVDQFGSDFQLSINKSPLQFHNINDNPDDLLELMSAHGLEGHNLCFEITEDSMMNYSNITREKLAFYKGANISIALDDFGKGYSSLSYLKDYNVDLIKLDRSFVQNLEANSVEYFLTEGVTKIARNLDVKMVAEGVETETEKAMLMTMGVDYIQGYLVSKPLPKEEFEAFMSAYH